MATERERFFDEMNGKWDGIVRSGVGITYPVWKEYGERLAWMEGFSPYVSVGISRQSGRPPGHEVTDMWGCRWRYPIESLDGIVIEHPLASWDALRTWRPPRPEDHADWKKVEEDFRRRRAEGRLSSNGTEHGFLFLRLTYLRGYENLMVDVAEGRPELDQLIAIIEGYWTDVIRRYIDLGLDFYSFGDDLGLQDRLPIRPAAWRRYIKPTYSRLFGLCESHGIPTYLHTDGYVVDIIPDLIECGLSILNVQELVNGLDTIARLAKGKVAIDMDIDRQHVTVFGTPEEVDAHIERCIRTLGSSDRRLTTIWGVYPHTPYENIEACVRALDRCATMWKR